nr:retrovirus-related Pol polyprotein from transposon TNT 1-94 [Tanacetum cinerariifolium]
MAIANDVPYLVDKKETFQLKKKGLVAEIFDWDEEEVSEDEEVTQVKVLMALADDELTVGKSHARNSEWVDITIRKVNTLLFMNEDANWQNYLKILYCMICKREDHRNSDHEMYIASLKISKNYKDQPYQYVSSSKQILKSKAKPFSPCIHCGFNDHRPDNCKNYPECKICGSYDHSTAGHNRVFHIRGGVLAESSQSNESPLGVKCNTCGSSVHSTSGHNKYDHFKRVARIEAIRIFLAFATYMNFKVYQMDVKSAFLNGKLKEVDVKQPPGFENSEFPDYVCKLDKALYGLKQAPKA